MKDEKSVRFRQEQVSVFSGNNCPLSSGFSVRNRRNMHAILSSNNNIELNNGISFQFDNEKNTVKELIEANKKGIIVDFGNHLNPQIGYVKTQIEKLLNE